MEDSYRLSPGSFRMFVCLSAANERVKTHITRPLFLSCPRVVCISSELRCVCAPAEVKSVIMHSAALVCVGACSPADVDTHLLS